MCDWAQLVLDFKIIWLTDKNFDLSEGSQNLIMLSFFGVNLLFVCLFTDLNKLIISTNLTILIFYKEFLK